MKLTKLHLHTETHFSLCLQERVGVGSVSSSCGSVQHEREKHQESHRTHSENESEPGASWEKGKCTHLLCSVKNQKPHHGLYTAPSEKSEAVIIIQIIYSIKYYMLSHFIVCGDA